MLENANGRRIALIINEFGDVGVDGELIKGCGDELCKEEDVVELLESETHIAGVDVGSPVDESSTSIEEAESMANVQFEDVDLSTPEET